MYIAVKQALCRKTFFQFFVNYENHIDEILILVIKLSKLNGM